MKKFITLFLLILLFVFCVGLKAETDTQAFLKELSEWTAPSLDEFEPCTDDIPYVLVNNNEPFFTVNQLSESGEYYSELDSLGRCGTCTANIGLELMPTQERESIGMIKPSGWQTAKYDFIDGKYLYNRCHLIGYQLTGQNSNEKNLITGTRYLNIAAMLPFENIVADYIRSSGNHVLYRVTPVYEGDNLLATGVLLEAESVEDEGETLLINIFCYNIQPGVIINYSDGSNSPDESWFFQSDDSSAEQSPSATPRNTYIPTEGVSYVLNTSSMKFHYASCPSVQSMSPKNRKEYFEGRDSLIAEGYSPCGSCKP